MTKRCIFHIPYELDPASNPSAPQLRPGFLIKAFGRIGYEVTAVTGYSDTRKKLIESVIDKLDSGVEYDFLYSECSSFPTLLTDPGHLPKHGDMDFRFFRRCRDAGIPIGLFYRDAYWLFPEFDEEKGRLKSAFLKSMYRHDVRQYKRLLDVLYTPSQLFSDYVESRLGKIGGRMLPLPPGCVPDAEAYRAESPSPVPGAVNFLYVGGVSSEGMYDLRLFFEVIRDMENTRLVACVRKKEWDAVRPYYEDCLCDRIQVVHLSGDDLYPLYNQADVGVMLFHPNEYRALTMPFKTFEYLGAGLPILATAGTAAGDLVEKGGCGWSVPFDRQSLGAVISSIANDGGAVAAARSRCLERRVGETWDARAQYVARTLVASSEVV